MSKGDTIIYGIMLATVFGGSLLICLAYIIKKLFRRKR